jgi:DNA-binding FrmR family transcriptional regulator
MSYYQERGVFMKVKRENSAVVRRLKRIEGQVRGLIKMVEGDKSCEEVLVQISSAKAALHKTGQVILEGHLHHCVLDGIREGNEEETMNKLSSAIEQFSRII